MVTGSDVSLLRRSLELLWKCEIRTQRERERERNVERKSEGETQRETSM